MLGSDNGVTSTLAEIVASSRSNVIATTVVAK